MLAVFRSFLNTWAARAFFIILVAAFALWGIADVIRNLGHDDALAYVGDERVDIPEFQEAFRQQMSQVSRMLGGAEATPAIRKAVAGQVLDRIVVQKAMAEEVRRLRLAVPDDALRQAVFEMPAFRGRSGSFDRATFDQVLRANYLTEGRFLQGLRADLASQQLMDSVLAGVSAPNVLLQQVYAFQHETRVAELITLPFAAAPAPPPPTDEDLRRLYEDNPAAYTAPAYRRIKLVILSPETVMRDIQVSDDDLRAYYDGHKAEYVQPERRSAQIIVTQDEAAANKLAAAWRAGADWPAMQAAAKEAGASDVSLDDATRTEFPATDLADAVFAAPPNTVTGPIKTAFGTQLIKVTKVTPGTERSFDQVKDEIRGKIARDRAVDLVYERANKLEDALSAGTKLDDLPGDLGLAALTGTLDANGLTQDGRPVPFPGSPPVRQAIVTAAFAAQEGDPPRMTEGPDQSYYALSVEEVIPPALKPFDAVVPQLRADYDRDRRRHAQEQVAARLLASAKAGDALPQAARLAGVQVQTTPPIGRDGPPQGVAPEIVQPLFGLKQGETSMLELPDGFAVFRLTQVTDPDPATDPAGAAQMRDALAQAMKKDVEIVLASALRERAHPRVNRSMLDSFTE